VFWVNRARFLILGVGLGVLGQQWWSPDKPPADYPGFPAWEGPVFVSQLFGLADAMCTLLRVRCLGWNIAGLLLFLAAPVAFTVVCTMKVYRLVVMQGTLRWVPSPKRTVQSMLQELKDMPGCIPRLSQLFVYGMELRYAGGWSKQGSEATFWGFLMGAYTGSFSGILTWVLGKKLLNALNKQLLDGSQNAVANIVIFSADFLVFATTRPFADNLVTVSQVGLN
jgi:hypothetical protein